MCDKICGSKCNTKEDFIRNELEVYHYLKNPRTKMPFLPYNVFIEPTNTCNLDCIMCARQNMTKPLGFLSLENFKIIIDKFVAENFYPPITLTCDGEPLMNKDIFEMIKYAKEHKFHVSMLSNSSLLDDEKIQKLIHSGLDRFQTDFDSIDKEEYEKIRRGSSYEDTKSKILKLIDENEKNGHKLYISIFIVRINSINKDNVDRTKEYWESKKVDNVYVSHLLSLEGDSGLSDEAMEGIDTSDFSKRPICVNPWVLANISYNGNVVLCGSDFNNRYVIGNIFQDSIQEMWNGQKAQAFRQALLDKDGDFIDRNNLGCRKCNCPDTGLAFEDYLHDFPIRLRKKMESFHG